MVIITEKGVTSAPPRDFSELKEYGSGFTPIQPIDVAAFFANHNRQDLYLKLEAPCFQMQTRAVDVDKADAVGVILSSSSVGKIYIYYNAVNKATISRDKKTIQFNMYKELTITVEA